MVKKTIVLCDVCTHYEGIGVGTHKCPICGCDVCDRHIMNFYLYKSYDNPFLTRITTREFSNGATCSVPMSMCSLCADKLEKMLENVAMSKDPNVIKEFYDFIMRNGILEEI